MLLVFYPDFKYLFHVKFSYTKFKCGGLFKENSGDSLCVIEYCSGCITFASTGDSVCLSIIGKLWPDPRCLFCKNSFIGIWPCPLVYILSMVAVTLKWQLNSCYIDWMAAEFKIFTVGSFKKKFTYLCSKSLELLAASVCGIQSIVPFGLCGQPPKY